MEASIQRERPIRRCCLNSGHHNNIAPGCQWKCWEGQVLYTLMFSLSEGMIAGGTHHSPRSSCQRGRKVKWERSPPLPKCWRCTLQTSTPLLSFLLALTSPTFPSCLLCLLETSLKNYWLSGLLVCSAGWRAEICLLARNWSLLVPISAFKIVSLTDIHNKTVAVSSVSEIWWVFQYLLRKCVFL